LLLKVPTFGNPAVAHPVPVPYAVFENSLPGISAEAYTFIESLQPYNAGAGLHNVLKILAQLSNIDKHRHLNVTMGRAAVHRDFTLKGGRQITSTRGGFKHGTKVPLETIEFDEVVDVNTRISTYITFDEPTVGINAATIEVQYALQMCIEVVESAVIPRFSQLLKNP
jgi:hypothetical protein